MPESDHDPASMAATRVPIEMSPGLATRRILGSTGLAVSPVTLGTMQFGWTVSHVDSIRILDAYRHSGGNIVDTANMYGGDQSSESFELNSAHVGVSEETIGRWLENRGGRDSLVLSTKVRARMWEGDDGEGLNAAHIRRAVDDSLRRLKTDYLDVLYAHWPDPNAEAEEWLEAFSQLVRAGKVRYLGTSNFCDFSGFGNLLEPLIDLTHSTPGLSPIQVEQPRYNLVNRAEYETALQGVAEREGLGIICYSSLASGFLAGAVRPGETPSGPRASFLAQYCSDRGWRLLEEIDAIAKRHQVPTAAVSLAWSLRQPGVTSVLIGPESIQELAEASWAASLVLDDEEVHTLTALSWDSSEPEFVQW